MSTVDLKKSYQAAKTSGRWQEFLSLAKSSLLASTDSDISMKIGKYLSTVPTDAARSSGFLTKKVAILGGYTTSFIAKSLASSLLKMGIFAETWEGEYGLLEQVILSQDPELADFKPDVVYFCVGSEHLGQNVPLESEVNRWSRLWEACHALVPCPIVLNTFQEPLHRVFGSYELKNANSRTRFIRGLNLCLADKAPKYVHFCDIDFAASLVGRKNWRDEKFYDIAKLPVAQDYLVSYADVTARVVASLFGYTKKCLVLDLDNTLWGGVIGDDGIGGIKIGEDSDSGEGFKRFQTYIRELKNRGVILAVCSKNDEDNAKEPFEKRSDMVLKLADISCFVANWEPKHLNIERIAKELNIGLDSLVFADDNPAEREIVRQNLPEVSVIEMPLDPSEYTTALAQSGLFEITTLTEEDLARTEQYRANSERATLEKTAGTYEDYLRSLKMTAVLQKFDSSNLPRITQLINKTNQFNLTTKRYTDADTDAMSRDPNTVTRYVKLRDRFGDNGLIAVLIAKQIKPSEYEIDSWLMSCRVLKRNVERLVIEDLVKELRFRGVKKLYGMYLPSKKNGMVKDLLPSMGFEKDGDLPDGGTRWLLEIGPNSKVDDEPIIEIVSNENYGQEPGANRGSKQGESI